MIKLKNLLQEAMDVAKKRYSWQTPYGNFIPIKYSHGSDALKFSTEVKDPIMAAWKKGYMRIVFMGNTLIAHNEVMPPNDKQKQELIDLALNAGDVAVEWDSGSDNKIIWSEHDLVEHYD